MSSALAGLGLSLSIIVALGAQNAFVLRQGLRRERVFLVVAICTLSDLALIALGVSGLGYMIEHAPWLAPATRWAGAAFLLAYAGLAAWRAAFGKGEGLVPARAGSAAQAPLWPIVMTTLALTWLNPGVYLDTVFLIGSVSATHGDGRWWFGAGAGLGSVLWFFALGFGARFLAPFLRTPRSWRVLDSLIAVLLAYTAVRLILV